MHAHGLIKDCARIMQASPYIVFLAALCYDKDCTREDRDRAQILQDEYLATKTIPLFVYDFCLDVIIGRIPVFNKKGQKVN